MFPVGFEPTISAGEWPQNYALDRAATGTKINKYATLTFTNSLPDSFYTDQPTVRCRILRATDVFEWVTSDYKKESQTLTKKNWAKKLPTNIALSKSLTWIFLSIEKTSGFEAHYI